MRFLPHVRFTGWATVLGGAVLSLSGCQSRPTPLPAPVPEAASLFIRNYTTSDVGVYAVPTPNGSPIWLTNVSAKSSQSLPVTFGDLQANGALVIRTQILGRTKTWTSDPLVIDDGIVGVLDLRTDNSITTVGSLLRGVTTQAFSAALR